MNNTVRISLKLLLSVLLFVFKISCLNAQSNPGVINPDTNTNNRPEKSPRPTGHLPHVAITLLLPGNETSGVAADGLAVYFSDDFNNGFGDEDSYKFTNLDENIGILRNGVTLSLEGRKPVTVADTLPIRMWQLIQKKYTLKVDVAHLADNVNIFFQDSYLQNNTRLENKTATLMPFTITDDAASFAPDRFRIVFETFVSLPVELSGIKAYERNNNIQVDWIAESESNMERYVVEKSTNAQNFIPAGHIIAKNNSNTSTRYSWTDSDPNQGNNYYRIKTVDKSGDVKYSSIVKVQSSATEGRITASTTPGQSNGVNLFFKNAAKGNYRLSLINIAGQNVFESIVFHTGGTSSTYIPLNKNVAHGFYQMQVIHPNKKQAFSILIQ